MRLSRNESGQENESKPIFQQISKYGLKYGLDSDLDKSQIKTVKNVQEHDDDIFAPIYTRCNTKTYQGSRSSDNFPLVVVL